MPALLVMKLLMATVLMAMLTGCTQKQAPVKIPSGATFEVFTIAAVYAPNTTEAIDPSSGGQLFLETPPILTTADVETVASSEVEITTASGAQSERTQTALDVKLTPAGSAKMATATSTLYGNSIAVVINGRVVCTPKLHSPIGEAFQITGIDARFKSAVEGLTRQP